MYVYIIIYNQHPRYLSSARLLTGQISDLARPAAWILHSIPPTSMDEPQNLHTGHGQYRALRQTAALLLHHFLHQFLHQFALYRCGSQVCF